MNPRELSALQPRLGAYLFSLLFVFTGVFTLRSDLLGKTILGAPEAAGEGTAEELEADASLFELPPDEITQALQNPRKVKPLPPEVIDTETLWLARCVYSETKRPEEQELVAWVVRNRVETRYRGVRSYREAVLDDFQFSAFNPGSRKRQYYSNLKVDSRAPGWKNALYLAHYVRHADSTLRPFPRQTRHFYSERAMRGRSYPEWSEGLTPVTPQRPFQVDARRFRFFAGVF